LAVAIEITPGATGALADTIPLILKQDSQVISINITITIYVPNAGWDIYGGVRRGRGAEVVSGD